MTDEETLKLVEWNVATLPAIAGIATRGQIKALVQDSRDLRALPDELPRCYKCDKVATREATIDGDMYRECDDHKALGDELPYAPVLRRIAARA